MGPVASINVLWAANASFWRSERDRTQVALIRPDVRIVVGEGPVRGEVGTVVYIADRPLRRHEPVRV